jgi:hypothetical protein
MSMATADKVGFVTLLLEYSGLESFIEFLRRGVRRNEFKA